MSCPHQKSNGGELFYGTIPQKPEKEPWLPPFRWQCFAEVAVWLRTCKTVYSRIAPVFTARHPPRPLYSCIAVARTQLMKNALIPSRHISSANNYCLQSNAPIPESARLTAGSLAGVRRDRCKNAPVSALLTRIIPSFLSVSVARHHPLARIHTSHSPAQSVWVSPSYSKHSHQSAAFKSPIDLRHRFITPAAALLARLFRLFLTVVTLVRATCPALFGELRVVRCEEILQTDRSDFRG